MKLNPLHRSTGARAALIGTLWLLSQGALACGSHSKTPAANPSDSADDDNSPDGGADNVVIPGAEGGAANAGPLGDPDVVVDGQELNHPTGLAFHPTRKSELWIVNYADDGVVIVSNTGTPDQTSLHRHDLDASHFMHKPTGIAMGDYQFQNDDTWATCGDNNNDDPTQPGFTGPALFSASLSVFAVRAYSTYLGSHLDMLHESPYCMGIAHVTQNKYWVFDGADGALMLYDFQRDHGPGGDDHSDGIVYRYVNGQLSRLSGVPSHLAYDDSSKLLYAADTGHHRVVTLDTTSGTLGAAIRPLDPIRVFEEVDGAKLTELVPDGKLQTPSGLTLAGGKLYVGDYATGHLHIFDLGGQELEDRDTGLGGYALGGIAVSQDGHVYFLDMKGSRVLSWPR